MAGAAVASALMLTACGGGGGGLTLNTTDGIAYQQATLTAPAAGGNLKFTNKSSGLQHNFVLVKGGDDVAAQVDEAGQADTTDYVPDGDANVIVASKLLNGGESATVAIPALPAGTYTYLCTFPGHYATGMKGTLTVQ